MAQTSVCAGSKVAPSEIREAASDMRAMPRSNGTKEKKQGVAGEGTLTPCSGCVHVHHMTPTKCSRR